METKKLKFEDWVKKTILIGIENLEGKSIEKVQIRNCISKDFWAIELICTNNFSYLIEIRNKINNTPVMPIIKTCKTKEL
jgi:hypothetical protein